VIYWSVVLASGRPSPGLTLLAGAPSPHPAYALLLGLGIELGITLLPIWHLLSRFRYPSVHRSSDGLELRWPRPLRSRSIRWDELTGLDRVSWFGPHDVPFTNPFISGGFRVHLGDGSAVAIHRSIEGYESLLQACEERIGSAGPRC
jgi:hypothetical protein